MLAEGCGEERGDPTAPSFGDCLELTSRVVSCVCPGFTIFRFLVEAVVKLGGLP